MTTVPVLRVPNSLNNVVIFNAQNSDLLVYNSSTGQWVNTPNAGGASILTDAPIVGDGTGGNHARLSIGAANTILSSNGVVDSFNALTKDASLAGDGVGTPFSLAVQHDASLTGLGSVASPLSATNSLPAPGAANTFLNSNGVVASYNAITNDASLAGNGVATPFSLAVQHDASLTGLGSVASPLSATNALPAPGAANTFLNSNGAVASYNAITKDASIAGNGVGTQLSLNVQHDASLGGAGSAASNLVLAVQHDASLAGAGSAASNLVLAVQHDASLAGAGSAASNLTLAVQHDGTLSGLGSVASPLSAASAGPVTTNLGLATSVAANALTVALKQADGSTDPSASAPTNITFRSSTLTSGAVVTRSVTGALSITIPSGTFLGLITSSGVQASSYIYVHAIDNAGTVELALSATCFPLDTLITTVAISGGNRTDVLYSTTTRTSVAVQYIGKFLAPQGVAGTWAANATEVQANKCSEPVFGDGINTIWNQSQSIPSGTVTKIKADAINITTRPLQIKSNFATSTGILTITVPGYYLISGNCNFNGTTATVKNMSIAYSGQGGVVNQTIAQQDGGNNAIPLNVCCSVVFPFAVGDTVWFQAFQNQGGAQTFIFNSLSMTYLGPSRTLNYSS